MDNPIGAMAGSPASGAPAMRARKRSRLAKGLRRAVRVLGIGIVVAVGSIACLVAVSWIRSQAAVAVVQAQVNDIRGGKVEEAYALFSTSYQAGVSLPMFRRWVGRQTRLAKPKNVQLWGRSVWGETAMLWGSFQDDLGHNYPVRYLLVREKGVWRIDGFQMAEQIPDSSPNAVRVIQT